MLNCPARLVLLPARHDAIEAECREARVAAFVTPGAGPAHEVGAAESGARGIPLRAEEGLAQAGAAHAGALQAVADLFRGETVVVLDGATAGRRVVEIGDD